MEVKKTMLMFLGMVLVPIVACSTLWAGELLVIANSGVSDEAVTRTTVSDIYLGKKTKWGNGEAIRVVMLKGGSTHERFVQEVVGTSPVKLKNYWKKVVFTGTGTPPEDHQNRDGYGGPRCQYQRRYRLCGLCHIPWRRQGCWCQISNQ